MRYLQRLIDTELERWRTTLTTSLCCCVEPGRWEDNLYCWHREKRDSNAEVDFVVAWGGKVMPVEVKSGTRGSMQSLRMFLQLKSLDKGIRTSLENFGAFDDILIYPLYAIGNVNSEGES